MNDSLVSSLARSAIYISDGLLGSIATPIAVLVVSGLGMMLLAGHLSGRRVGLTVLGCFVIFSARTIADGLMALAEPSTYPAEMAQFTAGAATYQAPPTPFDPYEGAAVPVPPQEFGAAPLR